jgi:translation elongation factor EF-Tu-like GTPase
MGIAAKVKLEFLTPELGGRRTPPVSGYRPPVWFGEVDGDGQAVLWDCQFEFASEPRLGSEIEAVLRSASIPAASLRPGTTFEVREGSRTVARGEVVASL